ncbi:DUF3732 domain-containing protein, partial [Pseudophaeobacter sp. MA21411-1]|nr:DUF3732 domain-containing protein [Pseudophaeobacter flagellatus]
MSISLALQRFFLKTPSHPVPGFLIYDQPSQVYFPKGVHADEVEPEWRDEDVEGVRKVFAAVSNETILARGNLLDLSRFDAAPLIAFTATKETDYGTETDGRIPARCGADCADQ